MYHLQTGHKMLVGMWPDWPDCPLPGLNVGGFMCTPKGVYKRNEEGQTLEVCAHPITPLARLVDMHTGKEKVRLGFKIAGQWREEVVPRWVMVSSRHIVQLAGLGVAVTKANAGLLADFLHQMMQLNGDTLPVLNGIQQLGWYGEAFVPYSKKVFYNGDPAFESLFNGFRAKGSFARWREFAVECRQNINLKLVLAASFSSVLLQKLDAASYILHLWGGSGVGKTVALMLAMSVWGDPELGKLMRCLGDNAVSMTQMAKFLHHLPVMADDMQTAQKTSSNMDKLMIPLCEGMEHVADWQSTFLFTGEEPLGASNGGGCIRNGVIEVRCDKPMFEDSNKASHLLRQHYGMAGPAFIKLVLGQQDVRSMFMKWQGLIAREYPNASDKQVNILAAIMVADQIATRGIFMDDNPLQLADLGPWISFSREDDMCFQAREWMLNWLSHNKGKFTPGAGFSQLWGRMEHSKGTCLVDKSLLEREMQRAGFSLGACLPGFVKYGWVVRDPQGRYAYRTSVNNVKAAYMRVTM